jgi:hypothetical protein
MEKRKGKRGKEEVSCRMGLSKSDQGEREGVPGW